MQIYQVIAEAIAKPSIPHEPARQSLKAWAMYCLRDRGFKVVYAQNADFAIEQGRGGDKLYFKVTDNPVDLDPKLGWIVWDSSTKTASLIPPEVS
ncbi:MAG: hypothetical protein QNJ63_31330 [Calothrix sp. MO_192.B10]|nr:hypothetical protein [Calothrix sp. MO_192.B10]